MSILSFHWGGFMPMLSSAQLLSFGIIML
jgi:hypothetical protein